jgi:hypothetical protein
MDMYERKINGHRGERSFELGWAIWAILNEKGRWPYMDNERF